MLKNYIVKCKHYYSYYETEHVQKFSFEKGNFDILILIENMWYISADVCGGV